MPNWAIGSVEITGRKIDIKRFASRFIFDNRRNFNEKFFARSFYSGKKKYLMKDIDEEFIDVKKGNKATFYMIIDFAWSAYSCLIDGYPQKNPECITLEDACALHNVSVKIETEECGLAFEEVITCDPDGNLVCECEDMPSYICKNCGTRDTIPSYKDLEECECYECEGTDWEEIIEADKETA